MVLKPQQAFGSVRGLGEHRFLIIHQLLTQEARWCWKISALLTSSQENVTLLIMGPEFENSGSTESRVTKCNFPGPREQSVHHWIIKPESYGRAATWPVVGFLGLEGSSGGWWVGLTQCTWFCLCWKNRKLGLAAALGKNRHCQREEVSSEWSCEKWEDRKESVPPPLQSAVSI